MAIRIIRLTAGWADTYRTFRLAALRDFPYQFANSVEQETAWPRERHLRQLEESYFFGALDGDQLVGTAAASHYVPDCMQHKASIHAVHVLPAYQRQGIARRLMNDLLSALTPQFEQLVLAVASDNQPAITFYESLGFKRFATEFHAAKYGDVYMDDVWMMKLLKGQSL
jgi:ribosomal protein S18 acetylase RimI-like enzyme